MSRSSWLCGLAVLSLTFASCAEPAISGSAAPPSQHAVQPVSAADPFRDVAQSAIAADSTDTRRAAMQKLLAAADNGQARPAAAGLLALLGDPRKDVRDRATQAILDISRRGDTMLIVEDLTQQFTHADANTRRAAVDTVARISAFGHTEKVVDHLSAIAAGEDAVLREHVAKTLGAIGRVSGDADVTLRVLLSDQAVPVRVAAASALGSFGGTSDKVVPALMQAVEDSNNAVTYAALQSLSNIGPPESVQLMRRLIKHADPRRRELAAAVLWRTGEGAKPALPELGGALRDERPEVRVNVLGTLGMLGPPSPEIEQAIFAATEDENTLVRAQAAVALGRVVRTPQSMARLAALFGDTDSHVRYCAVAWLMTFREQARGTMPDIVRRLGDEDAKVRHAAEQALQLVGPAGGNELPGLMQLAVDSDAKIRQGARAQLVISAKVGGIRESVLAAVHKLRETVDDQAKHELDAMVKEIAAPKAPKR